MKPRASLFGAIFLLLTIWAIFSCLIFPPPAQAYGKIIYVDRNAPGVHDGTSWDTAYVRLQDALDEAFFDDEIWVARGTYRPTVNHGGTGDRYKSFQMKNGVAIYGGFNPLTGDTTFEDRDWKTNETILSGDIGIAKFASDNCYHVFYHPFGLSLDATAVLDGFTIAYGNANNSSGHEQEGGGMYNDDNSPTLANCVFRDNSADLAGGGIFNKNWASPVVINTIFTNNTARDGGGMHNLNYASPSLTHCIFDRNLAENHGGGLMAYMHSSPTVTSCTFKNNKAIAEFSTGGGMYNGWGGSPTLANCLFYYNNAYEGGAIGNTLDTAPIITNCTFFGNWSDEPGWAVGSWSAAPEIINSIIWGNGPTPIYEDGSSSSVITYCDVSGGYSGTGNIASDPLFRNIPGSLAVTTSMGSTTSIVLPDGAFSVGDKIEINDDGNVRTVTGVRDGTVHFTPALDDPSDANIIVANWGDFMLVSVRENFRLQPVSPCIEAGSNGAEGMAEFDMDGDPRIIDGDNDGAAIVDMGIDEVPFRLEGVIFVDEDATGANTGLSWGDAFNDLQDALDAASPGDSIWVAEGIYRPSLRSSPDDPRSAAFRLQNNVALYGGFDPTAGDTQFENRDWENNETILSGDITRIGETDDNSYHVFYHPLSIVPLDSSAVLDGFTISDGNASDGDGGAMFNLGASPTVAHCIFRNNRARDGGAIFNGRSSNPILTQCTFLENRATRHGGGMYNEDSSPSLTDCIFGDNPHDNRANRGGGVYNRNGSPNFTTCRFEINKANYGGGMYNESSAATLTGCTFDRNSAWLAGFRGGGMYCENASPNLIDCVFTWNRALSEGAGMGGALFCDVTSAPTISGGRFENNWSDYRGGAIYCDGASPTISDTVLSENRAENDRGGGIYISPESSPVITECTFQNNMAKQGGGICCDGASPSIVQCQILGNEATLEGGGIFIFNYAAPTISGSTIDANYTTAWASMGGGMYCSFSSPIVQETVISNNTSDFGAGVMVREYSEPAFSDCTISNNTADGDIGGVDCREYSSASFSKCTISGNSAIGDLSDGYGGGVGVNLEGSVILRDCQLWENHAAGPGGAVVVYGSGSSLNVINSIFWDNETNSLGGGIYNFFASAIVTNSTFWRNTALGGGGGLYNLAADNFAIGNSILWANTADQVDGDSIIVIFSNIQDGYTGTENIDADPLFRDPDNGDFHLSENSPSIDAGYNLLITLPDHDFEGDDRIIDGDLVPGAIVDMGADEFLPTGGAGDFDEDGDVDGLDLRTLAEGYGTIYDEDFLSSFAQNYGRLEPY